jgi:hypothetical protein
MVGREVLLKQWAVRLLRSPDIIGFAPSESTRRAAPSMPRKRLAARAGGIVGGWTAAQLHPFR